MINRLRRVSRSVASVAVAIVDKEDALMLIGLAMIAAGLWQWSRPLALIVPGVVLLWLFLPARPPFVETSTPSNRVARRPPS